MEHRPIKPASSPSDAPNRPAKRFCTSTVLLLATGVAFVALGCVGAPDFATPDDVVSRELGAGPASPSEVSGPPPGDGSEPTAGAPSATAVTLMPLEADLTSRLNAERAAAGLPVLAVDGDVVRIARIRSRDMADGGYFGHTSPDGETAFTLLDQAGIPHSWAAENLASNTYSMGRTVDVAIRNLMTSPPHRANILDPNFTRLGVGYAEDGSGMHYYTIIFLG